MNTILKTDNKTEDKPKTYNFNYQTEDNIPPP